MGEVASVDAGVAFGSSGSVDGGAWSWGQRALTRVAELETLAHLMRLRAAAGSRHDPDPGLLEANAVRHLRLAGQAVDRGWQVPAGAWVDRAMTNMNAAACLILRYTPLEDLRGMLPDLAAVVEEQLSVGDRRRVQVEELLRRVQEDLGTPLEEGDRVGLAAAVRAATTPWNASTSGHAASETSCWASLAAWPWSPS